MFIVPFQLNLRRMYLTRIKNSTQHFHISSLGTSELVAECSFLYHVVGAGDFTNYAQKYLRAEVGGII